MTSESNVIIETTGQYFSEVRGDIEDDITLSSIVEINGNNELHNTNLLTTLTSLRIQALMNDGMTIQTAISTAESELLAALSPLLPTLNSPSRFAGSLLISRRQQNSDLDSNAYLLALSSVFDQLAQSRALANNDSAAANMGLLIESVANDLAINGELTNSAVMNELINAMTELNPDQVLLNLFLLDSELESVANASDLSACEVLLGELTCADDSDQNQNITSVIANLNKFWIQTETAPLTASTPTMIMTAYWILKIRDPTVNGPWYPLAQQQFSNPTLRTDCLNGLEFNQQLP